MLFVSFGLDQYIIDVEETVFLIHMNEHTLHQTLKRRGSVCDATNHRSVLMESTPRRIRWFVLVNFCYWNVMIAHS